MHSLLRIAMLALALVAAACVPTGEAPPLGSAQQGLTLHVPGDETTIQAALGRAVAGDVIEVAAGDYTENLTVPAAVSVVGAPAHGTVLHGQIKLNGDGISLKGLKVVATGAAGLPSSPAGIAGDSKNATLAGNWVEGFTTGIKLTGSDGATVRGNKMRLNATGIEVTTVGALLIAENLVVSNTRSGIRLNADAGETRVLFNTLVGNGFGEALPLGGAGIVVGPRCLEHVKFNVAVSNRAGINHLATPGVDNHTNLIWGNSSNYAGSAVAGAGDLSADPMFVDAMNGDFHLKAGSPAIDLAPAGEDAADFDGIVRPQGAAADLGAFEFSAPAPAVRLVVSEVMANPIDENRGEFVEVYNLGLDPVDLAGMVLSDGDAKDTLVKLGTGTTVVAPGAYAVILDPDYVSGYNVPQGVTTVTVNNTTLGNGLSNTDSVTLYAADKVTVLAAYANPFDPGNGVSAERVDLNGADLASNWRASPCLQSAGRPNCAPVTLANGLVISEVMANPLDESTGEFVELYNGTEAPIDAAGMKLTDGQATDALIGYKGGTTVVPARGYAVILDPEWPADQMFRIDPAAVLLTVSDTALGNGLAVSDPVSLISATGSIVDSYTRTLSAANGKSVEKVSLSAGDAPGNWAQSSCADGSSPGRLNCVSSATSGPRKPLAITEVMNNPLDEDRGEFIELYNKGIDPVDAAGLLLSDGDATDVLTGFAGGTTVIPAGAYAVIVDSEYVAGTYVIPAGAVLLTTTDSTLGSGLSIDDPLKLLESNGVEVIDTFRYPFNPGNGISAERIDVRAFDAAGNWVASTCPTHSSPGALNCAASAAGMPKRLRITEVMSNQAGTETGGAGEFVELFNDGTLAVDLAGMTLESGPEGGTVSRDRLQAFNAGATVLAPNAYAVVVDPNYDGRYAFPQGAVVVTISDTNFGSSGLATTHTITLYDVDGITALDKFRYPSDPGDGVSLSRVSVTAADSAANWVATSCNATPGAGECPSSGAVISFWADRDASEGGHFWVQAIGWPEWYVQSCENTVVCTGGSYNHAYKPNLVAQQSFSFTNPYSNYSVVFVERAGPADFCGEKCPNMASVTVPPGATQTVPASSLGYYFASTSGPALNSLDWYNNDPALYWALPPAGTLAPFTVTAPAYQKLDAAALGTLFPNVAQDYLIMSETDVTLRFLTGPAATTVSAADVVTHFAAAHDAQAQSMFGTSSATALAGKYRKEVDAEDFFNRYSVPYDPSDSYIVENARKFANVVALLKANLTDLHVYRFTEGNPGSNIQAPGQVSVFIVGLTVDGKMVAVMTGLVET
ncbi:MAG: lamin tail domain-containing protein [Myxococcales bacterium]